MSINDKLRRVLWKFWYPFVTKFTKKASLTFLNYGFNDDTVVELKPEDEQNRMYIQLYHHVASAVDLTGLDVMEVSCGQGGGASYVTRYLKPKSMLGVDLNHKAIEFCQQMHQVEGLSFSQGDAENLQFEDQSFDVILNVEASHCYSSVTKFVAEVHRLLKPGGYFLIADLRMSDDLKYFDKHLRKSGLEVIKTQNITSNVLSSLSDYDQKKRALINQVVPRFLRKISGEFAGVKGSYVFDGFESGKISYVSYVLKKPSN